jgi:hypothetical protein
MCAFFSAFHDPPPWGQEAAVNITPPQDEQASAVFKDLLDIPIK